MAKTKVANRELTSKNKSVLIHNKNKCDPPEIRGQRTLQKRARRVAVSKPLAGSLSFVTTSRQMKKQYQRTYYQCGQQMVQADGKITSWWCGYRWCVSCSVIRVARMYSGYGQQIEEWGEKYFVTLTIPNVKRSELRQELVRMSKVWRACYTKIRKQGIEFKAVRSVEVTYNPERNDYHPHMHCIVAGKPAAKALLQNWMKRNSGASILGQDMRRADDSTINEVFKYAAKLSIREKGKVEPIPAKNLDVIYQAMSGLRMWSAVGIRSANGELELDDEQMELRAQELAFKRTDEMVCWEWMQSIRDWVDLETGEVLSEYVPSPKAENFIKKLEEVCNG